MKSLTCLMMAAAIFSFSDNAVTANDHVEQNTEPAKTILTVTFTVERREGAVMAALFDNAAAYKAGEAADAVTIAVDGPTATAVFHDLLPGRVALKVFQDLNGDAVMNVNPFGMPVEPFAFSNDAMVRFGPLEWEAAAFPVKAGRNVHTIVID